LFGSFVHLGRHVVSSSSIDKAVDFSFDPPQNFEQSLESGRFAEDHFLHLSVVLFQLRQTGVWRHDSERARFGAEGMGLLLRKREALLL
jgi:hypothetical protein